MEESPKFTSYLYKYVNSFRDKINPEDLVKQGYIKDIHEPITDELVDNLGDDFGKIFRYMSNMTGSHVTEIYENIEKEFPDIIPVANDLRVENKILTSYVTIPGVLEFKFDIESPMFTAERKIATIYVLNYRGQNLLSNTPIQLYKSTGKSRGTGLDNLWLPYSGRDTPTSILKKPEDKKFGYLIEQISADANTYSNSSFQPNIEKFNKLLPHFKKLLKYKRFMDIDYALSSYLVSKYEYEPLPKTAEELQEEEIEAKKAFKLFNIFFGRSEPSKHKFYYEKYIKYKHKYMELKNKLN